MVGGWSALVGAVVVVVGLTLVVEGLRLTFMRYFPAGSLRPGLRSAIRQLGRIGTVARGLVFALAGALVVSAAWTYQPAKAGGLDAALKTLRDQPYGPVLLGRGRRRPDRSSGSTVSPRRGTDVSDVSR